MCHAAARIYTPALVSSVSATHTVVDVSLEGVEDLLYGLDVGLQVPGFLRHPGQRRWQHRVQVEAEHVVHGLTGERRLEGGRGATHVLVVCPFFSFFCLTLSRFSLPYSPFGCVMSGDF